MSDNDYMVTQKEAADFLKVSTKSIGRYRKRGLPYKLVLNPVTGKQEVRFRYADLERWDEGRQLLATYARDGKETTTDERKTDGNLAAALDVSDSLLEDLLLAYKQQIELLREQLEDMRGQLARRDRQIDDLMRLMMGLQLEYKPMPVASEPPRVDGREAGPLREAGRPLPERRAAEIYEAEVLPVAEPVTPRPATVPAMAEPPRIEPVAVSTQAPIQPPSQALTKTPTKARKVFSWEQLAVSIQRLRDKGKSYDEIARGLNQISVATVSGHPEWTVLEVQALLPGPMAPVPRAMTDEYIL